MNTALVCATVVALFVCGAFSDHHIEKKMGKYHAIHTTGDAFLKLL
jgi:hypothetical protein